MANNCGYALKAVGKKENLQKLAEIMQRDYNCTSEDLPHLWRIFSAEIDDITEDEIYIYGDCAWSVYSCMFDGNHTYQKDDKTGKGTTITALAKELNLDIEIFSEEPGCGFMEHFLINNCGELEIDDCIGYYEYYIEEYDTLEEAIEDLNLEDGDITQEEFDEAMANDGYVIKGGIEWDYQI